MATGRTGVVALGAAVAALLGGWAMTAGATVPADEVEERGSALEVLEVLAEGLIPPADALAKAAAKAEGTPAVEMELTTVRVKNRRTVAWEVVFLREKDLLEVRVDARTGEVLDASPDDDAEDARKFRALLEKGGKGLGDALGALGAGGGGLLLAVELDDEKESAVWEAVLVRSGRSIEVLVDTATGKAVPDDGDAEDDDEDDDDEEDGDYDEEDDD